MDASTILAQYGLAGLVIAVLAGVVIYLNRLNTTLQKRIDDIQESRLADARETRDKLTQPMEQLANVNGKMYEILIQLNNKRGA